MRTRIAAGILALVLACVTAFPVSGQSLALLGGYAQPNSPDLFSDIYSGNVEIKMRGTYDIDTIPLHLLAQGNYSRSSLDSGQSIDSDAVDGGAINRIGGMMGFGLHIDINSFRVYANLASGIQATRVDDFEVIGLTASGSEWTESIAAEGALGIRVDILPRIALQAETSYTQLSSGENPSWLSFLGGVAFQFN